MVAIDVFINVVTNYKIIHQGNLSLFSNFSPFTAKAMANGIPMCQYCYQQNFFPAVVCFQWIILLPTATLHFLIGIDNFSKVYS